MWKWPGQIGRVLGEMYLKYVLTFKGFFLFFTKAIKQKDIWNKDGTTTKQTEDTAKDEKISNWKKGFF